MDSNLKNVFEYELKRKLSFRTRRTTSEIIFLINAFKFFDINKTGKTSKTDFIKVIERIGLIGFNQNALETLFSMYDPNNSGYINYDNFCRYIYGEAKLEPLIKDYSTPSENKEFNQIEDIPFKQVQNNQNSNPIIPNNPIYDNNNNSNYEQFKQRQNNFYQNQPLNNNINNTINDYQQQIQINRQIEQSINNMNRNINNDNDNNNNNKVNEYETGGFKKYFKTLATHFQQKININNGITYYSLEQKLKEKEDRLKKTITFEDFSTTIQELNINIEPNFILDFFSFLDLCDSNSIATDEILRIIRGNISEERKMVIIEAFARLDYEMKGFVEISYLKSLYNAKEHPDCKMGKKNENDIINEFNYTFDIYMNYKEKSTQCSFEDFIEYYSGISASIENEQYFKDMINGVWNMENAIINNNNIINQNLNQKFEPIQEQQNNNFQIQEQQNQNQNLTQNQNIIPNQNQIKTPTLNPNQYQIQNQSLNQNQIQTPTLNPNQYQIQNQNIIPNQNQIQTPTLNPNQYQIQNQNLIPNQNQMQNQNINQYQNQNLIPNQNINPYQNQNINPYQNQNFNQYQNQNFNQYQNINQLPNQNINPYQIQNPNINPYQNQNFNKTPFQNQNVNTFPYENQNINRINQNLNKTPIQNDNINKTPFQNQNIIRTPYQNPMDYTNNNTPNINRKHFKTTLLSRTNNNKNFNFFTGEDLTDSNNTNVETTFSQSINNQDNQNIEQQKNINLSDNPEANNAIDKLRNYLLQLGSKGIFNIEKMFTMYDPTHKGKIDFQSLESIFQHYKLPLSSKELKSIFDKLDYNSQRKINYDDLVKILVGKMTDERLNLVKNIFAYIKPNNNGSIHFSEIRQKFNPSKHPQAYSGSNSKDEIYNEFIDNLDIYKKYSLIDKSSSLTLITLQDFINFYTQISFGINDDSYFNKLISGVWNYGTENNLSNNNRMMQVGNQIINNNNFY